MGSSMNPTRGGCPAGVGVGVREETDEGVELPEATLCGGVGYCVLAKLVLEEGLLPKISVFRHVHRESLRRMDEQRTIHSAVVLGMNGPGSAACNDKHEGRQVYNRMFKMVAFSRGTERVSASAMTRPDSPQMGYHVAKHTS